MALRCVQCPASGGGITEIAARTGLDRPQASAGGVAERGFPKLQQQTPECTEWLIAASAAATAEATLNADVVPVDRSALDPVAYYLAAVDRARREPDPAAVARLSALATAHASGYGLLIATVLDPAVPLGDHRDRDLGYRAAVDRRLHRLLTELRIPHQRMGNTPDDQSATIKAALALAEAGR
ncbi:AAA family ATPase [Streptomyces pacificus]|nr:AAA family ATPase [Streptomyces pacificus]